MAPAIFHWSKAHPPPPRPMQPMRPLPQVKRHQSRHSTLLLQARHRSNRRWNPGLGLQAQQPRPYGSPRASQRSSSRKDPTDEDNQRASATTPPVRPFWRRDSAADCHLRPSLRTSGMSTEVPPDAETPGVHRSATAGARTSLGGARGPHRGAATPKGGDADTLTVQTRDAHQRHDHCPHREGQPQEKGHRLHPRRDRPRSHQSHQRLRRHPRRLKEHRATRTRWRHTAHRRLTVTSSGESRKGSASTPSRMATFPKKAKID